jgi:hypothetical protein
MDKQHIIRILALGGLSFIIARVYFSGRPQFAVFLAVLPFVYLSYHLLLIYKGFQTQEDPQERSVRIEERLFRFGLPILKYGVLFVGISAVVLLLGAYFGYNIPPFISSEE